MVVMSLALLLDVFLKSLRILQGSGIGDISILPQAVY